MMLRRFAIALPLIIIPAAFFFLGNDAVYFIKWWLLLLFIGLIWWPVAARLFPAGDKGWFASKGLGFALSSLITFLLHHFTFIPFSRIWLIIILFLSAVIIWTSGKWAYKENIFHFLKEEDEKYNLYLIVGILETAFAFCLLLWTFARGLKPDLDSLEKFMNIGFMNSLWRSDTLPAADMWLSGAGINYYYFGHYAYTWLSKIVNIQPVIAYQLAMATTFALTAALSFSIGFHLMVFVKDESSFVFKNRKHRQVKSKTDSLNNSKSGFISKLSVWLSGFLSMLLIVFGGNQHSFLFDADSPGNVILKSLSKIGIMPGDITQNFWFANSTRYIGYNPDTTDKTIHEFPYYSFLVADLHAHVINLTFVLLLIGILIWTIKKLTSEAEYNKNDIFSDNLKQNEIVTEKATANSLKKETDFINEANNLGIAKKIQAGKSKSRRIKLSLDQIIKIIKQPEFLLIGVMLAIFMMGNFWDFIIYFALSCLVFWLAGCRTCRKILTLRGLLIFFVQCILIVLPFLKADNPLIALFLYFLAFLIGFFIGQLSQDGLVYAGSRMSWLFFLAHFISLPFNIRFEPIAKTIALVEQRTPFVQLWVLWGAHVMGGLVLIFFLLIKNRKPYLRRVFPPLDNQKDLAVESHNDGLNNKTLFINKIAFPDQLVLAFYLMGLILILLPELVYVVDIYSGDFKRANTMFKFTYQAFILLSLVWAYTSVRILKSYKNKFCMRIFSIFLVFMMIIPLWYPFAATEQWLGNFRRENYQGLDPLINLAMKDSPQIEGNQPGELAADVAAIKWLNNNIKGQPVVLEAYGDSYTDYNRISAFTGLPTIIGWQTHEWLWRTSNTNPDAFASIVVPRQNAVRDIYTTSDQNLRLSLIEEYNVEYIVIGQLEREKFSVESEDGRKISQIREDRIGEIGEIVFEQGHFRIYYISDKT